MTRYRTISMADATAWMLDALAEKRGKRSATVRRLVRAEYYRRGLEVDYDAIEAGRDQFHAEMGYWPEDYPV